MLTTTNGQLADARHLAAQDPKIKPLQTEIARLRLPDDLALHVPALAPPLVDLVLVLQPVPVVKRTEPVVLPL